MFLRKELGALSANIYSQHLYTNSILIDIVCLFRARKSQFAIMLYCETSEIFAECVPNSSQQLFIAGVGAAFLEKK